MAQIPPTHVSKQASPHANGSNTSTGTEAHQNRWQHMKKMGLGGAIGYGFVGFDTYFRVQDGESFLPALGKAALTNAIYANVPGGIGVGIGVMAAQAAIESMPAIMNAVDQMGGAHASKYQMFNGGFLQSENQSMLRDVGMNVTQRNQERISSYMSRHAMRNHKIY